MKRPFARSFPSSPTTFAIATLALLALTRNAAAQNPAAPAFAYEKPPEKLPDKPVVEWKVQAKGGLLLTSGNSRSQTGTFALDSSRKEGANKLALNAGWAYGNSSVLVPNVDMVNMVTTGYHRESRLAADEWKVRGRYDRFITLNNAAYALAQIGADRIAGKRRWGGAQVGYSRQLVKSDLQTLVAELGYDFSYESYMQPGVDAVAVHSARVFAGELLSLTKETGISGSVEALFNLNKEQALDASDGTGMTKGVGAFKDTRLMAKLGLTTTLRKALSFGFGFTLKYDNNPAPQAPVGGAPPYMAGFQPFAQKTDTLTEATLIYTFL